MIGYGVLGMFLLDLPPIAFAYVSRPFDPSMDATLVTEVLERVGVPLIAFAFIFGWAAHDLPRWERVLRKFLSHLMLVSSLLCLGLAGLAISAGVRNYTRAATILDFRANERAAVLTLLGKQVNTLNASTLRATYDSVVHPDNTHPTPNAGDMRKAVAAGIPAAIDDLYATAKANKARGKRQELIAMGKYSMVGLIAAVVFFVLWEASYSARSYRIFRSKDAPGLGMEAALVGGIGKLGRRMEGIRLLPNWEDYAWYRRLRRKWRHRGDKKHR